MDFKTLLRPTPRRAVFAMEGWYVWGASMARTPDGVCHLYFSRWPRETGMRGWVTHSEIGYAVADAPLGPYTFQGVALAGRGTGWDAEVTHNPTVLYLDGAFYLYYMGTRGPGGWWDYRNNQRIGVAVAQDPGGPWKRFDAPVVDVSPGFWDALMTSNPAVTRGPDGRIYMMYKGVGMGPMPKGGAVLGGMAVSDRPTGPFVKHPRPVVENPDNPWAVEDAFIWHQGNRFYAVMKDFHGYFTRDEKATLALFESADGLTWKPSPQPLAARREIEWEDGEVQRVARLERPQIWLDQGRPAVLFCACRSDDDALSWNVHMPLSAEN